MASVMGCGLVGMVPAVHSSFGGFLGLEAQEAAESERVASRWVIVMDTFWTLSPFWDDPHANAHRMAKRK